MNAVLESLNLEDAVPLALLVSILWVVGSQMAKEYSIAQVGAKRIAACGFVAYAIAGIAMWAPDSIGEVLEIVVRALLAGGLLMGMSLVLLPIIAVLYRNTIARALNRKETEPEPPQPTAASIAPVESPEPPPQDPAPTTAERASAAQQRYDERLRVLATAKLDDLELKAAREHAKQQYLKDLDEVMR